MKFSGSMCLKIILKVTKNQAFILFLEDIFFEKPQGGEGGSNWPPTAVLELIIDLYFLIHGVIAQIFNSTAELVTPIGIPIKEAKTEMETHPVILEAKIESVWYNLEFYKSFCAFYLSIHFALFLQEKKLLFRLYFLD